MVRLTIALAAFGALALFAGVLARTGGWRRGWVERYRNRQLPRPTRNGVFGLIPLGSGLLLVSPGMQCGADSLHRPAWCGSGPDQLALVAGITFVVISVFAWFIAPNWSKPSWLREAERNKWLGFSVPDRNLVGSLLGLVSLVVFAGSAFYQHDIGADAGRMAIVALALIMRVLG